jgi:hypothetical protein
MTRRRLIEVMTEYTKGLFVSGWASETSGHLCQENNMGHLPKGEDTLIERTESQMAAPDICKHCGDRIRWNPKQ